MASDDEIEQYVLRELRQNPRKREELNRALDAKNERRAKDVIIGILKKLGLALPILAIKGLVCVTTGWCVP